MPVPVPILAEVDHRLRMARGEAHVPFGGLCVILCGDFAQLPPVGARSLMTAVVTQPDDTPRRRRPKTPLSAGNQSGCSLFCLFKRYDLAPREFSFSPAGYHTPTRCRYPYIGSADPKCWTDDDFRPCLKIPCANTPSLRQRHGVGPLHCALQGLWNDG